MSEYLYTFWQLRINEHVHTFRHLKVGNHVDRFRKYSPERSSAQLVFLRQALVSSAIQRELCIVKTRSFDCLFVMVMLFMHPVWFVRAVNCCSHCLSNSIVNEKAPTLPNIPYPRSVDCIFITVMLFIQPIWFAHIGYMGHSCLGDSVVNETAPTLPYIYTHVQLIAFLS